MKPDDQGMDGDWMVYLEEAQQNRGRGWLTWIHKPCGRTIELKRPQLYPPTCDYCAKGKVVVLIGSKWK